MKMLIFLRTLQIFKKPKELFLLTAIISAILLNLFAEINYSAKTLKDLPHIDVTPPGEPFAPLRPFLAHIPMAGYYTDQSSSNPGMDAGIMGLFQQAQYTLSPTLLDFFHGLDYEYIIFYCSNRKVENEKMAELNAVPIARIANGITLVRKIKQ